MNVFIGADHRGFQLKQAITAWLTQKGYDVTDCGNNVLDPADDYPDFAFAVADGVAGSPESRGVVICGSGVGVTIAANKVKGIRCSTATGIAEVKLGREDDDLNVLALSANYAGLSAMQNAIEVFLKTPFKGDERHVRRLNKIKARENG